MTTIEIVSLLIMPIGGLLIGALGLLWVRSWDREEPTPGRPMPPAE